jgi:acyl-CoA reductase-like NAD-dependent aldehyde dehydrogenase
MRAIDHWIDGKPVQSTSESTAVVWNPATGRHQAYVPLAGDAEVDAAVAAAARRGSPGARRRSARGPRCCSPSGTWSTGTPTPSPG